MLLDDLLTEVLKKEGWPAFTDHTADRGGATRGGVSLGHYNRYLQKQGLDSITVDELKVLPESAARAFFADAFATPFRFVADEPIFVFLVDWAVNAGPDDPAKALQTALKARGFYEGAIDGVAGPKTRQAWYDALAAGMRLGRLKYDLVRARVEFHLDRAFDAPFRAFLKSTPHSQAVFTRGWINRTLGFLAHTGEDA